MSANEEALRSVGRAVRWARKSLHPELNDAYAALGLCGDLSVEFGLRCTRKRGHEGNLHAAVNEGQPPNAVSWR